MWRHAGCTLAVVIAWTLAAAAAVQDAEKHVFVTATDKDGVPIVGLTAEHFAVKERGRERRVLRAEPLRTPMHVAVLVDTSAANGSPDETFRSAVLALVERLASSNEVSVYAFGDRATRVAGFTRDAAGLRSATEAMFGWSHRRSHLIDAVDLALRDFDRAEFPRPVIIAITSESPEASGRTAGGLIKRLISQSVAFHSITLASATGSGQATGAGGDVPLQSQRLRGMIAAGEGDREREQMLQQGTSATGGGRQRVTSTLALAAALARTANELANSYKVTFARAGSAKMEDLQVGVLLEGVTLRATAAPFGTR